MCIDLQYIMFQLVAVFLLYPNLKLVNGKPHLDYRFVKQRRNVHTLNHNFRIFFSTTCVIFVEISFVLEQKNIQAETGTIFASGQTAIISKEKNSYVPKIRITITFLLYSWRYSLVKYPLFFHIFQSRLPQSFWQRFQQHSRDSD